MVEMVIIIGDALIEWPSTGNLTTSVGRVCVCVCVCVCKISMSRLFSCEGCIQIRLHHWTVILLWWAYVLIPYTPTHTHIHMHAHTHTHKHTHTHIQIHHQYNKNKKWTMDERKIEAFSREDGKRERERQGERKRGIYCKRKVPQGARERDGGGGGFTMRSCQDKDLLASDTHTYRPGNRLVSGVVCREIGWNGDSPCLFRERVCVCVCVCVCIYVRMCVTVSLVRAVKPAPWRRCRQRLR